MTNLLYFKTVVEAEAEAMEVIVSNGSGREKKQSLPLPITK